MIAVIITNYSKLDRVVVMRECAGSLPASGTSDFPGAPASMSTAKPVQRSNADLSGRNWAHPVIPRL